MYTNDTNAPANSGSVKLKLEITRIGGFRQPLCNSIREIAETFLGKHVIDSVFKSGWKGWFMPPEIRVRGLFWDTVEKKISGGATKY